MKSDRENIASEVLLAVATQSQNKLQSLLASRYMLRCTFYTNELSSQKNSKTFLVLIPKYGVA